MSYSGATAASSLANPPRQIVAGGISQLPNTTGLSTAAANPGNQGGNLWYYCSTNASTDFLASNFFTDGYYIGMRPGDVVMAVQFTSAGSSALLSMSVITGVSTSGASLSTGGTFTSTYN